MATIAQLDVVLGTRGTGTFRRDMAGVAAAVGTAAFAIDRLLDRGGQVAPVTRAFTRSVGNQRQALDQLRRATSGLVSDYDLMVQTQTAFTLGSAQNVDEMARLAEGAQRLGRALGLDAEFALNSLNTGIARQSRLLLDNLGIIVDVDAANAAYAATLGVTTAQLTDAQRADAFRLQTLRQVDEVVATLGPNTRNAADAWAELQVSAGNAADRLAEAVANSSLLRNLFDAAGSALSGDIQAASDAFTAFLVGQKDVDRTSGPPTTVPGQIAEDMEKAAVAAGAAVPPLSAVARGILAVNDGQVEFVDRTSGAVVALDVYALAAGRAADEVTRLSQAQSILSSAIGGLGALGQIFGFGIPGVSQLSGLLGLSRSIPGLGGFVEGLFGGARASGGPVDAGRAYLVGEQGPELVVPKESGTVIPNGGMSINVSMTAPRNGAEALRDREWLRALQMGADSLKSNGYSFA